MASFLKRPRSTLARRWAGLSHLFRSQSNFYRLHLTFFILAPLVAAFVFWLSDLDDRGRDGPRRFIDILFLCTSAITVTGLATNNLSTLSSFQQSILFVLMFIGCVPFVSVVLILVRRYYFQRKFTDYAKQQSRMSQIKRSLSRVKTWSDSTDLPSNKESKQHASDGSQHTHPLHRVLRRARTALPSSFNALSSNPSTPELKHRTIKRIDPPLQYDLHARRARDLESDQPKASDKAEPQSSDEHLIHPDSAHPSPESDPAHHLPGSSADPTAPQPLSILLPSPTDENRQLESPEQEGPSSALLASTPAPGHIMFESPPKTDPQAAGHRRTSTSNSVPVTPRSPTFAKNRTRRKGSGPDYTNDSKRSSIDVKDFADGSPAMVTSPRQLSFTTEALPEAQSPKSSGLRPKHSRNQSTPDALLSHNADRSKREELLPSVDEKMIPLTKATTFDFRGRESRRPSDLQRDGFVSSGQPLPRTMTMKSGTQTYRTTRSAVDANLPQSSKHRHFGGFPQPYVLVSRALNYFAPNVHNKLHRAITMPRSATIVNGKSDPETGDGGAKEAPYISFNALIGRNSNFIGLSSRQKKELGGVEYRALNVLTIIVISYYFGVMLIGFTIIGPYSVFSNKVVPVLAAQSGTPTNPAWFGAFNVVSAFSNAGMSLLDTGMNEIRTAYPITYITVLIILAGNTCFPIFLRLLIWILIKFARKGSELEVSLRFLLDHPRRCFIYLFPSHQTWFLAIVVFVQMCIDFVAFLVLDIGNEAIDSIPVAPRVSAALLQAAAVRAAGFAIVNLSALAPAVQVLYVVMMYIAVYPIAMAVRSTNVYEEKSLGVFEPEMDTEEPTHLTGSRGHVVGEYFSWHVRRQLADDIWWLALALWLICIVERGSIMDGEKPYINIFSILFELVSAFATVGLSLGVADNNYSLSGDLRKISKLILIIVMIRGRHRGLPIAIDHAVLLPKDITHIEHNMPVTDTRTDSSSDDEDFPDVAHQNPHPAP